MRSLTDEASESLIVGIQGTEVPPKTALALAGHLISFLTPLTGRKWVITSQVRLDGTDHMDGSAIDIAPRPRVDGHLGRDELLTRALTNLLSMTNLSIGYVIVEPDHVHVRFAQRPISRDLWIKE